MTLVMISSGCLDPAPSPEDKSGGQLMVRADSISALGNLEGIIKIRGTVGTDAEVEKIYKENQKLASDL